MQEHLPESGRMAAVKEKINSTSVAIVVGLVIIGGIVVLVSIGMLVGYFLAMREGALSAESFFNEAVGTARGLCMAAVLFFIGSIFSKIALGETPFVPAVPKRLKVAAFLLFFGIAVPQWAGYIVSSILHQTLNFTVFDELTIMALMLAAIVYCVGLIFEYGCMVQNENDEIL